MPIILQSHISREDLQANPAVYYVFGDNDARKGRGGLAKQCRGMPNAIGIRTKKFPGWGPDDYYTDDELDENIKKITEDFEVVWNFLREGKIIIVPLNGIGTGLANMSVRCPDTFRFLQEMFDALVEVHFS